MIAELLSTIPLSGAVRERHFDVSAGHNAWVRFDDGEGDEWVGVFGATKLSGFDAVAPFGDDGGLTILVIAGGQGYVVGARSGELLRRTPWFRSQAVIAPPECDFVLVADETGAWATGRQADRPVWRRDRAAHDSSPRSPAQRLALDGIVFQDVSPQQATGRVREVDGWYAFTIDLRTLEFSLGPFLSREWPVQHAAPAV